MKKYFLSAAVFAIFATGCQNEIIENQSNENGELFSLEVVKGMSSRTELVGTDTNWSKGDKIYVSGDDGNVAGVLTLEGNGGSANGKFTGYILGGKPAKLEHIVFPVPQDGKIDMSKRNPEKLDVPMVGTIENGAFKSLHNVGGLLAIKTGANVDEVLGFTATSDGVNMTGGSYKFNPVTGTLEYIPANNIAYVQVAEDGVAYIPVATVANEAVTGTEEPETLPVIVEISNAETNEVILETQEPIEVTTGKIYGDDENETIELDGTFVSTLEELNAAIAKNENVVFANDITGDITIVQQPDVKIAINGNNKKFFGTITVDGKSATYTTAGLTIKNLNFNAESNSAFCQN